MKKSMYAFAIIVCLGALSATAFGGQTMWAFVAKAFTGGGATLLNVDAAGNLLESNGALATNNIVGLGAPILVKAGVSRMVTVSVSTASGVGTIYDAATTGAAAAANQIGVIPATAGTYIFDWPMSSGIVINPASSVIAVKYN